MNNKPVVKVLQKATPSPTALLAVQYANEAVANKTVPYTWGGMHAGPRGQSTENWSVKGTLLTANNYNTVISGKVGSDCSGFVRYAYGRAWGVDKFGGTGCAGQATMPIGTNYWPIYEGVDPTTVTDDRRFLLYQNKKLIVDYPATIARLTKGDIIFWTYKRDDDKYTFPQIGNGTNVHTSIYIGVAKDSGYNIVDACVANAFSSHVFPGIRNTKVDPKFMGYDILDIKRII